MYIPTHESVIGGTLVRGPEVTVDALLGKTLKEVRTLSYSDEPGIHTIVFTTNDDTRFVMFHDQDCCETVMVKDITGDLATLIGAPLVMAEEVSSQNETEDGRETWTFYKFATDKGYVTISWLGESNGYYSESVSLFRVESTDLT